MRPRSQQAKGTKMASTVSWAPFRFIVLLVTMSSLTTGCAPMLLEYTYYGLGDWFGFTDVRKPPLPTINGPEASDLMQRVTGTLVMVKVEVEGKRIDKVWMVGASLVALRLPDQRQVMARRGSVFEMRALSGPDADGRIAWIDGMDSLKVVKRETKEGAELFFYFRKRSISGRAEWGDMIGRSMALAPVGGQVALIREPTAVHERDLAFNFGSLQLWDVEKSAGREMSLRVVDKGLSWFPDGRRLAYVALVPKKDVPADLLGPDGFGADFTAWDRIPVVYVLDITSMKKTFTHVGWNPIVSSDGNAVLVGDAHNNYRLVDVASGRYKAVRLPGDWRGAVALLNDNLVLYLGLPTTGSPYRYTWRSTGYRDIGEPMGTLKVVEVNSGRFQTVIPYVHPAAAVAFSVASQQE